MDSLLLWIGRVAGWVGVLTAAVASAARLTGTWTLGGLSVGTVLQAGMASMLLGCLAYCASLAERSRG